MQLGRRFRLHPVHVLALPEGQTLGLDQAGRLRSGDADDAEACPQEADREDASDGAWSEDRNRHVRAGSAMRLTYFHSVYTSSASTPASRQPVPDCLTPPKPMCGSLP